MILSHRHRFIFIKGIKVAGTSVEIALSQICGEDDIITPITPVDERLRLGTRGEPRNYSTDPEGERQYLKRVKEAPAAELRQLKSPRGFYNHMPLTEVLEKVPAAQDYRLIFVERSPYAKVISYANWDANHEAYMRGQPLPRTPHDIQASVQKTIEDESFLKVRNIERYRDGLGKLRSTHWPFEEVEACLRKFVGELNEDPVPMVHAKQGLGSERVNAADLLLPEQIGRIDEAFAEEFEMFGYPRLAETVLRPAG